MKDYQKNKNLKSFIYSRPVIILLFLLVLIFAYGVAGFWRRMQVTTENRVLAERKIADLEQEKKRLVSDIEKLKTDDGVEDSIRSKFGLAKAGEGMIVVVDQKDVVSNEEKEPSGVWSFIKNLFR
jgi:cell division protein FtsB